MAKRPMDKFVEECKRSLRERGYKIKSRRRLLSCLGGGWDFYVLQRGRKIERIAISIPE